MTERLELYKCETCGNLVEVILPSVGELVCCGHPMTRLIPEVSDDGMSEKHVPVFVETAENGYEVRVGRALHPMVPEHYIQFVETISKDKNNVELQYFAPQDIPIMVLKDKLGVEKARAFCNIHGLWEGYRA